LTEVKKDIKMINCSSCSDKFMLWLILYWDVCSLTVI